MKTKDNIKELKNFILYDAILLICSIVLTIFVDTIFYIFLMFGIGSIIADVTKLILELKKAE